MVSAGLHDQSFVDKCAMFEQSFDQPHKLGSFNLREGIKTLACEVEFQFDRATASCRKKNASCYRDL